MWGSAPVIGVPLVLLFNTIGLNPIVALAGMSLIWPLGDALPPTAIIGRLTVNVVGYQGSYGAFLQGLRRAGDRHRDPRHADGDLQREAGVAHGALDWDSGYRRIRAEPVGRTRTVEADEGPGQLDSRLLASGYWLLATRLLIELT